VLGGTILVMTLVLMQLVVAPAMSKISNGEEKQLAAGVIQGRWHPVVDAAIIVQSLTAVYLMVTRWELIGQEHILHVKVTFGITALVMANLLHFYYRGKKRRLKTAGEMERLAVLSKRTATMEKVTLVTAAVTWLLAVTFNHLL